MSAPFEAEIEEPREDVEDAVYVPHEREPRAADPFPAPMFAPPGSLFATAEAVPYPAPHAFPVAAPEARRVARKPVWLLALLLWIPALGTLAWNPLGGAASTALEVALWLLAIAGTLLGAARSLVVPAVLTGVLGVAAIGAAWYGANWSGLEPRTYFALHRPMFASAGQAVRDQQLGAGQALPPAIRPISAAAPRLVGGDPALPAILLPQPGASPASGYVYYDGEPDASFTVDLAGRTERLVDGLYLGSGWWWL